MAITLVGHSCLDNIVENGHVVQTRAGGVPVYGMPALLSVGRRCFIYTKYNPADVLISQALSAGGKDVVHLPAQQTTAFAFNSDNGVLGEPSPRYLGEPIIVNELDFSRSKVVYFAPLSASDIDAECFAASHNAGKRVIVDAQGLTREIPSAAHRKAAFAKLVFADVVKVTSAEAVWLFGSDQPGTVLAAFRQLGVNEVVITSGAQGSWIGHGEEIVFIPAERCPSAVDTVGCGDMYFSVYTHARLQGHSAVNAGLTATAYVAQRLSEGCDTHA